MTWNPLVWLFGEYRYRPELTSSELSKIVFRNLAKSGKYQSCSISSKDYKELKNPQVRVDLAKEFSGYYNIMIFEVDDEIIFSMWHKMVSRVVNVC